MNARLLILPLFLTGALMVGCDKGTKTPEATDAAKTAADTKAAVKKDAADVQAAAEKTAANAQADADKAAADAKAAADKAAADAKREQP